MNKEEARQLFPQALRDELSPQQAGAFEQALADHPGLERELEAFADTETGGGVENVTAWLEYAGATGETALDTYDAMARETIRRAEGRKRGRLLTFMGAVGAAAAAAAVIAVLVWPRGSSVTEEWPRNTPGEVVVLSDGYRHYERDIEEFHPAEGVTLSIVGNSLIRPHERGARLDRGEVRVTLDEGAIYDIIVGDHRVEAQGPGELTVTAEPLRYPDTSFLQPENDPMLDSKLISRFGAKGFAMALTVVAGSATLHGAQAPQQVNAPQTIQAKPGPGKNGPKLPKAEDIFEHLDANDDDVLDGNEVPARMIQDFDDDSSGDIDLQEFKDHHKPKKPRKPEDEFDHLDLNGDGNLDNTELPQKLVDDMDKDSSGDVDLQEFKQHWQHKHNPGPKPGQGFDHLDLNGDGVLDNTEVPQDMVNDMDADNSGGIDKQEFIDGTKPPTPDEVFDDKDANGDGKLDANEADPKMIQDFDDDNSGDIDLDEFKDHWRPRPPKPEDRFEELDKNDDGELDVNELPRAHVNDWDDDGNGTIDLDEFKAHHPKPRKGPGGPGGKGPGGKGPGGPGGPGGKGPGGKGPGGPGPKPPLPPHK